MERAAGKRARAIVGSVIPAVRQGRVFNGLIIAASITVAFAGFARSFYLRGLFHHNGLAPALSLHGGLMTAWFVLTGVQFSLVAAGQSRLHRRLGWAGALIAPLVLVVGLITLVQAAARQTPPFSSLFLTLLIAFDGISLLLFGAFAGAAIMLGQRRGAHARWVILAMLALLPPALGRMTLLFTREGSNLAVLLAMTGAVAVIVIVDALRLHRLHPVFAWGGGAILGANLMAYFAQTSS